MYQVYKEFLYAYTERCNSLINCTGNVYIGVRIYPPIEGKMDASFHLTGVKREIVCKIVISVNTQIVRALHV